MRVKFLLCTLLLFSILLTSCGSNEENKESVKVPVKISVKRTGNILTNLGALDVLINGENVFEVNGDSTKSVEIMMPEGTHTIQTKGQGDKSKKLKFNVTEEGDNEFYFWAEISNWWGVKLEEKKYIPTN